MNKTKRIYLIAVLFVSTLLVSAVQAQNIPEDARRHMARGMAAVEMANSPEEYGAAITEFQAAARLAPGWPNPHVHLGLAQERAGNFEAAAVSLKEYLRLDPTTPDAEKIQEQIYKLEYKAEQVLTESEIIDVLVYGRFRGIKGHFTPIKGKNPDRGFSPERFRVTNGRLLVCDPVPFSLEPCYGSKDFGACMETLLQCLPVTFDGKKLEYQCTHYRCPGCLEISSAPYKRSYKRDIVSTSPLRIHTIQVDTKEYGDKDDTANYEYLEEWVND